MPKRGYAQQVGALSDRLVEAQREIRVLDAVSWDDSVREAFFAARCGRQPPVDAAYYARRPLRFAPAELRETFRSLERDIAAALGTEAAAARILLRMCREYRLVIELLESRGTPRFAELSAALYGRSTDPLYEGEASLGELAEVLVEALSGLDASAFVEAQAREIPTERAVAILQERLDRTMADPELRVRVCVDDGIVADAAAGSDYIKLRKGTLFSDHDLRVLEAHEGWVHVGTSLNGRAQPACRFLGKGTPSTSVTQEGLAVLVEVVSLRSHPARLQRITDRIRAIRKVEEGASFLEVFRWLRAEGRSQEQAWSLLVRVFRGSSPTGGPFTKDLSYSRGFIELYNFLRLAVRRGRVDRVPLLFVGKVLLEEIGLLAELDAEGILAPPRFLPPVFRDFSALSAWMSYSNFLNRLDLSRVEPQLAELLA